MTQRSQHILILTIASVFIPVLLIIHMNLGETEISWDKFWNAFTGSDLTDSHVNIIRNFRIPRAIMALIAGSALSLAGLLMQTLFNNPLAGPYVLGINSGSSLLVALTTMTGFTIFQSDIANISSALLGAFVFGIIILFFARLVKSHISLLLVGLMLGSFTSAFVALIQAESDLQGLKVFTMWSLGSLQNVDIEQLPIILLLFVLGVAASLWIVKPLNNLVIGETHTRLLGFNVGRLRLVIIVVTALLTGLITAYCGPISFVGLAVPNIVRIAMKTQNHRTLILGCLLFGGLFLLICDMFIQIMAGIIPIPINVLTSILGAPIVVFIVLKKLA